MSNRGLLCYKKGGSALCYKKGGNALIFKGEKLPSCAITISFDKQSWECDTYHCYHDIRNECSITSSSGITTSNYSSSIDKVTFDASPSANASLIVTFTATTSCSALNQENPGITFSVFANQQGASPIVKANNSASPNTNYKITFSFNASGYLTNVNISR